MKRKINEDRYLINNTSGLYVIADGMGGHRAGEVASRIVVDTIGDYWMKISRNEYPPFIEPVKEALPNIANHLLNAIRLANIIVYEAQQKPQYQGMGSTVSALVIDKNRIWSANVGDTRIYLLRQDSLKTVSEEHSIEAEQKNLGLYKSHGSTNPFIKNLLTRALGLNEKVDAFVTFIEPVPGDMILMCSDGLTNFTTESAIKSILNDPSFSTDDKVNELINAANNGGGGDNTTVILLEILKEGRWNRLKNSLKLQ
ncbi:MAG: serine/threonine-protein phosphatase [Deltaproteobacteria bacterium]|nr:serine/threonine-protein phosphatase [Deltaproteobacteria bacterium]